MTNAFDSVNYPTREPDVLIAGDRWLWKRTDLASDYPVASYTLKYSLRLESAGTTEIEITAAGSGTEYLIEIAAATTAAYSEGTYEWQAYLTRDSDSERITIGRGHVEVRPNRDAATSDPRSHVKKVLDAVRAVIEGTASKEIAFLQVGGLGLSRRNPEQLMALERAYAHRYQAELRLERRRRKGRSGLTVLARMP
ncbi:MAG: hypothetical protein BMS9Abin14_289 [Gammaproteobacteria bacterium]|nr:MAG: hypothetical protein BMS9Abin14_289 [Gammaproteobacteria bacterium]